MAANVHNLLQKSTVRENEDNKETPSDFENDDDSMEEENFKPEPDSSSDDSDVIVAIIWKKTKVNYIFLCLLLAIYIFA